MSDFKHFFGVAPSDQNALDLFAGEWSSQPPAARPELKAGVTPLFDDPRMTWAHHRLMEMGLEGGVVGRDVLELGPLEGGHSYMLGQLGAKSVTAIEANARAYLKCLIAKETFAMQHARFLLGDCLLYLRSTERHYDVGIACGILYHLTNPVELLDLLARRCNSLFLWTVFYDPEFVAKNPVPGAKFSEALQMETAGYKHTVHRFNYGPSLDWKGSAAEAMSSVTGWKRTRFSARYARSATRISAQRFNRMCTAVRSCSPHGRRDSAKARHPIGWKPGHVQTYRQDSDVP